MAVVYRHLRNDIGTPFYVGIGKTNKRAYSKKDRNDHWHKLVNKAGYFVDIIYEGISWEEACKVEQYLIGLYGRKDLGKGGLMNMTDGGEGVINSPEACIKISKALTGKVHTKERVENAKRNRKEKYIVSAETKEKQRIAAIKRNENPEYIAKLSAAATGRTLSEETIAKRTATLKANKLKKLNGEL